MSADALAFPFDTAPEPGRRLPVADGVHWVRQPLPFALDHVNCWLLGAEGGPDEAPGDGATLVDTGIANERTRALWHEALGGGWPTELLVTHFHPDHAGLAAWFVERGAALLGNAVEVATSHRVWYTEPDDSGARHAAWYARNGLPEAAVERVRAAGNGYRRIVVEPPAIDRWRMLVEGERLVLGGREFRVLVGRGHAPEMLMLHDAAAGVLIVADQVLPTISPNVSLRPLEPDPDPLASFLASLETLRALPADTLVLPSHGLPFRGLHTRLDALAAHHLERLEALREATAEPLSAFELFPVLFRRELDAQQLSFALGETLAHLVHRGGNGESGFERTEQGGVVRWQRR